MKSNNECYDDYTQYEGYEIVIYKRDKTRPAVFRLDVEEFNERKELLIWLDFLIKTDQWVPYAVYKDLFGLEEDYYPGLRVLDDMEIHYIEYSLKTKKINFY